MVIDYFFSETTPICVVLIATHKERSSLRFEIRSNGKFATLTRNSRRNKASYELRVATDSDGLLSEPLEVASPASHLTPPELANSF
jgi:hypothetical protein